MMKRLTRVSFIERKKYLIYMTYKILVSKKNHMVQKIHLNTSLDIMIKMSLDH